MTSLHFIPLLCPYKNGGNFTIFRNLFLLFFKENRVAMQWLDAFQLVLWTHMSPQFVKVSLVPSFSLVSAALFPHTLLAGSGTVEVWGQTFANENQEKILALNMSAFCQSLATLCPAPQSNGCTLSLALLLLPKDVKTSLFLSLNSLDHFNTDRSLAFLVQFPCMHIVSLYYSQTTCSLFHLPCPSFCSSWSAGKSIFTYFSPMLCLLNWVTQGGC